MEDVQLNNYILNINGKFIDINLDEFEFVQIAIQFKDMVSKSNGNLIANHINVKILNSMVKFSTVANLYFYNHLDKSYHREIETFYKIVFLNLILISNDYKFYYDNNPARNYFLSKYSIDNTSLQNEIYLSEIESNFNKYIEENRNTVLLIELLASFNFVVSQGNELIEKNTKLIQDQDLIVQRRITEIEERIISFNEAKNILDEAVLLSEIPKQNIVFNNTSRIFAKSSKTMMCYTIGSAIITSVIILSLLVLPFICNEWFRDIYTNQLKYLNFMVSKTTVAFLGFVVTFSLFKTYKSLKHNEILNKHRANSMSIFETVYMTVSPADKPLVMKSILDNITLMNSTGFENKDTKENISINDILTLLKNMK